MEASNSGIPDDIAQAIRTHVGDPVADLCRQTKLAEDLGFDSLDAIQMIVSIEELRGIELSDDDIDSVTTVGGLIDAVDAAASRSGSQP